MYFLLFLKSFLAAAANEIIDSETFNQAVLIKFIYYDSDSDFLCSV